MRPPTITAAALLAVALSMTACSRGIPEDPGPGPEAFVEEEVAPSVPPPSPTPSQAGVPVAGGCPEPEDVTTAVVESGAVEPTAGTDLAGEPVCAGTWSAATVATSGDPLYVVLQTRGGRLYVVVAGSALCGDADIAGAPATIRAAVGC